MESGEGPLKYGFCDCDADSERRGFSPVVSQAFLRALAPEVRFSLSPQAMHPLK